MHIGESDNKAKVNRYWDSRNNVYCIKLLPGEYYYTNSKEFISTTLGSCVSACIWDETNKIGGMNHFMLPLTEKNSVDITWGSLPTEATRYGNYAMEYLINEMIKHGADRKNFKLKVFGGGKIIAGLGDIGQRNIDFVLHYAQEEKLTIISKDLGDSYPRKILFDPQTGRAWMKKVVDDKEADLAKMEDNYRKDITSHPVSGEVDLF
ncbi:MAG: chemoreceptor glutamine deamidase CheD [Cellvibrionaceae bacterium]|nr:chemoreceptor glutamine deamidase CheD [Cellvibrionaceae bacterium]